MLWDWVLAHLSVIVPVALPLAFTGVNFALKWHHDVLNVNLLGADTALASTSLFVGTTAGALYHRRLADPLEVLTAFVLVGVFLFLWWLSLSFGCKTFPVRKGSRGQPVIGFMIGAVSLYNSCVATWQVIERAAR